MTGLLSVSHTPLSVDKRCALNECPQIKRFNDLEQVLRRREFPAWVELLYELGVTSATFHYRECNRQDINECGEGHGSEADGIWRWEPTLIRCHLTIQKPCITSVVGAPCNSKEKARASAVDFLYNEINEYFSFTAARSILKKPSARFCGTSAERHTEIIKELLMACDSNNVDYLSSKTLATPLNANTMILYELVLNTPFGAPLLSQCMNTNHIAPTKKIGVLFPYSIHAALSLSVRCHVKTGAHDRTSAVRASLTGRTIVDDLALPIALANGSTVTCLDALQRFNESWLDRKKYGFDLKRNRSSRVPYLLVPLLYCAPQGHGCLCIDYEMVREELSGLPQPLLVGSCLHWTIPLMGHYDSYFVAFSLFLLAILSYSWNKSVITSSQFTDMSVWNVLVASFFLVFSMSASILSNLDPHLLVDADSMRSFFLLYDGAIFVTSPWQRKKFDAWSLHLLSVSSVTENELIQNNEFDFHR